MVDIDTAAELAGVKPNTITQWIRRGHLRSYRRRVEHNGAIRWRVFVDERELLLAEQRTRSRGGVHA